MSQQTRDILAAFDANLPLERARTIPSAWYVNPCVYDQERRAVFGDSWLVAGLMDDVSEPGSFLTTEIAGEPILVVRDNEEVLRAFYNVCRHRAAPLCTQHTGKTTRLRCRYHGWTYDLAGRLRGTPEFDGVADFRREDNGLMTLNVATWGPYVWVQAGSQPSPLEQFIAPLPVRTTSRGIQSLRFVRRQEYDVACNWKVYVDNYLDGGYHVNSVHPGLAGVLDYTQYRTEVVGNTSVQISPLKPPDANADTKVSNVRMGNEAQYWWVFPNFMLNLYDGVMDTNIVLPLGPDRCRVVFDFFFAQTEGAAAEKFMPKSMAVAHQVQLEDIGICEEVQRGLCSRSYDTGRFSVRREIAGYHFHQILARRLQRGVE